MVITARNLQTLPCGGREPLPVENRGLEELGLTLVISYPNIFSIFASLFALNVLMPKVDS